MREYLIVGVCIAIILVAIYTILKVSSNIRSKVYKLFIKAEKEAEKGHKMDYVVEYIYSKLPYVVGLFLNEDALRWILQQMFNGIKDFLDDGKVNKSTK